MCFRCLMRSETVVIAVVRRQGEGESLGSGEGVRVRRPPKSESGIWSFHIANGGVSWARSGHGNIAEYLETGLELIGGNRPL